MNRLTAVLLVVAAMTALGEAHWYAVYTKKWQEGTQVAGETDKGCMDVSVVASVNTGGYCIQLCDQRGCKGKCVRVTVGEGNECADHGNLETCGQPSSNNGVQCALASENSTKWYSTSCDDYHAYICQFNSTSEAAPQQTCPKPVTRPSVTCPPPTPCPTCPPPPQKRCSPGWTYSNVTNKCCIIVSGFLKDVRNQCGEHYAELVSVHSDAENFWITDYILNSLGPGNNAAFLGLYDKMGKCGWAWFDGTSVGYTKWGANQPFDCKGDGWNGTYVVFNPDTWNNVGFRRWGQAHFDYGLVAPCVKAPS